MFVYGSPPVYSMYSMYGPGGGPRSKPLTVLPLVTGFPTPSRRLQHGAAEESLYREEQERDNESTRSCCCRALHRRDSTRRLHNSFNGFQVIAKDLQNLSEDGFRIRVSNGHCTLCSCASRIFAHRRRSLQRSCFTCRLA